LQPSSPAEDEIASWMDRLSNWGRWGAEDELGTLNYITPEKRRAAAGLVREGRAISCARPISYEVTPDNERPLRHFVADYGFEGELQAYRDEFVIGPHGATITHVDAFSHVAWQGRLYNGRSAREISTHIGARVHAIDVLGGGVFTRGVLLDIARLHGREWLEPGEAIYPDELEAAERRQGVRVEEGDALLVRTGSVRRREVLGPPPPGRAAGLQAACLPWLHARGVALLSCDTFNDVTPSGYGRFTSPIHTIGLVSMGLWLVDNGDYEELTSVCATSGRWAFLYTFAPLKFRYGTGSPVNPLAVF
jgi:kynurenine formamidase